MRKKTLKLLKKAVLSALFFGMIIYSLFFAFGFRFDSEKGEFIQTGILEIDSYPESVVYIDDEYIGITPQFLRGMPIKNVNIRLERSGFYSWQNEFMINIDHIVKVNKPFLIPKNIKEHSLNIAYKDDLLVSPSKRALIFLYKDLKAVYIIDLYLNTEDFYFFDNDFNKIYFSADGEIITSGGESINIFDGFDGLEEPDNQFFARNNELWKYIDNNKNFFKIRDFDEKIDSIHLFKDSESIFLAFKDKIMSIDYSGENEHILTNKDDDSPVFSSNNGSIIIWQKNDRWIKLIRK